LSEPNFGNNEIKDISFSECGEHLVLQSPDISRPRIISIKDESTYQAAQTNSPHNDNGSKQNVTPVDMNTSHGPSTLIPPLAGKVLKRSNVAITQDVAELGTVTVQQNKTSGNLEVQRHMHHTDSYEALSLTVLPAWPEINESNVAVQLPSQQDDSVNIILNRTAKRWYTVSDSPNAHLPAMIQRDQRSIKSTYYVGTETHDKRFLEALASNNLVLPENEKRSESDFGSIPSLQSLVANHGTPSKNIPYSTDPSQFQSRDGDDEKSYYCFETKRRKIKHSGETL
jgi:hypothetical protein